VSPVRVFPDLVSVGARLPFSFAQFRPSVGFFLSSFGGRTRDVTRSAVRFFFDFWALYKDLLASSFFFRLEEVAPPPLFFLSPVLRVGATFVPFSCRDGSKPRTFYPLFLVIRTPGSAPWCSETVTNSFCLCVFSSPGGRQALVCQPVQHDFLPLVSSPFLFLVIVLPRRDVPVLLADSPSRDRIPSPFCRFLSFYLFWDDIRKLWFRLATLYGETAPPCFPFFCPPPFPLLVPR